MRVSGLYLCSPASVLVHILSHFYALLHITLRILDELIELCVLYRHNASSVSVAIHVEKYLILRLLNVVILSLSHHYLNCCIFVKKHRRKDEAIFVKRMRLIIQLVFSRS